MAKRDTYRYRYPDGYAGVTNDRRRRAGEHRRAGRRGTMKIVGQRVTRESALKWERGQTSVRSHWRRLPNGRLVRVRQHTRS